MERTTPKFKKNDIVFSSLLGKTRLHIYQEPQWCNINKTWSYAYDYGLGGTSEGFALEHLLKTANKAPQIKHRK